MTNPRFEGLTGNERLYEIGKYHEFHEAVRCKDGQKMESILQEIEIGEEAIGRMFQRYGVMRPKQ